MKYGIRILFALGSLLFCLLGYSQRSKHRDIEKVGQTVEAKDKNIDWESFDTTSIVSIQTMQPATLQGLWKAKKGIYKFGEIINEMKLSKPFIVEIKDSNYRRNATSAFEEFVLDSNKIISKKHDSDMGIVNKITKVELVITWTSVGSSNYTRYYYNK